MVVKVEKGFYKDLNKLMKFSKEGIFSVVLAKSNTYNHTLMCLAKGSSIDTHTSTKSGIVQVLKGEGIFILDGKKIKMKQGTFIFMPKNAAHSLKANKDLAFLLYLSD